MAKYEFEVVPGRRVVVTLPPSALRTVPPAELVERIAESVEARLTKYYGGDAAAAARARTEVSTWTRAQGLGPGGLVQYRR